MTKHQDPNPRHQTVIRSQFSSHNHPGFRASLRLGACGFSECRRGPDGVYRGWILDVGAFTRMSLGFALLFGFLSSALAQTNTTHAGNRFLIALETSRSMERRSEGTLKALQKLLSSGL